SLIHNVSEATKTSQVMFLLWSTTLTIVRARIFPGSTFTHSASILFRPPTTRCIGGLTIGFLVVSFTIFQQLRRRIWLHYIGGSRKTCRIRWTQGEGTLLSIII